MRGKPPNVWLLSSLWFVSIILTKTKEEKESETGSEDDRKGVRERELDWEAMER